MGNRIWFWNRLKRVQTVYAFASVAVVGFVAFFFLGTTPDTGAQLLPAGLGAAAAALWLAILYALSALVSTWRARKLYRQSKYLHSSCNVTWSSEGISFHVASGQSRHNWSDFVRWMEGDSHILLFHNERLFNFIPKACLTADDIADLRECLRPVK